MLTRDQRRDLESVKLTSRMMLAFLQAMHRPGVYFELFNPALGIVPEHDHVTLLRDVVGRLPVKYELAREPSTSKIAVVQNPFGKGSNLLLADGILDAPARKVVRQEWDVPVRTRDGVKQILFASYESGAVGIYV